MSAPANAKEMWRLELASRLAGIAPADAEAAAGAASRRFLALPEVAAARGVLVCLSFGPEISTAPLVAGLEAAGKALYVPRADPTDRQLHVHRYPCDLVTLSFGLCQPPRGAPEIEDDAVEAALDMALVLGLGFDEQGIRLGHGRGYFDRFLARHPVPAVGFAYECQVVPRLPREPHDVPMRALVTEAATRRIGAVD